MAPVFLTAPIVAETSSPKQDLIAKGLDLLLAESHDLLHPIKKS